MVVNILEQSASMDRALDYNSTKVSQGVASVLAVCNIGGTSEEEIRSTFERYERINFRSSKISFHASINPAAGEDMSDEKVAEFARKYMQQLGYGNQPFVLYKHEDIGRVHYHIVSIRTDARGKKIPDLFEHKRSLAILESLSREFGYVTGKGMSQANRSPGWELPEQFIPGSANVVKSMRSLFMDSIDFKFTTYDQFISILWLHGLLGSQRTGFSTKLYLQGLDENGKKACTNLISEKVLGIPCYKLYAQRAQDCKETMRVMRRERERICNCAKGPLGNAKNIWHFRNMLMRKQILFEFHRDPQTRRIDRAHFVDVHNRCAFGASELGSDLTLSMIQEADKGWGSQIQEQDVDNGLDITLGDFLAGLAAKGSKSQEKDLKDDPRKKKKGKTWHI
jgi:Relaxase/Mobilisation nuclease domain.